MLDFIVLAQQCAPEVAPKTLAAVVRHESEFNELAIGVNGGTRLVRQPASKLEAVITAKWLLSNGYNIDLGLGQINSTNLTKMRLSVEDAFEPCKNLGAAAKILQANYLGAKGTMPDDQAALRAALSAYNTGSYRRGLENGYVQAVMKRAGQGVAIVPIPLTGISATHAKGKRQVTTHGSDVDDSAAGIMVY